MPSQPPRAEPVKKKEILAKREHELQHALRNHGKNSEKVQRAAEKVRAAKVNVFKGIIEQFRFETTRWGGNEDPTRGAKVLKEQNRWQALSIEEIIFIYEQHDT